MIRHLNNLQTKCSSRASTVAFSTARGTLPRANDKQSSVISTQAQTIQIQNTSPNNNDHRRSFSSLRNDDIFVSINTNVKQNNETKTETAKLINPLLESEDDSDFETIINAEGVEVEVNEHGMEQEQMFIQADVSMGHDKVEWGGPRRGGRFSEPTRFGDWERKGRCTDF